jgi:hypothetical protein
MGAYFGGFVAEGGFANESDSGAQEDDHGGVGDTEEGAVGGGFIVENGGVIGGARQGAYALHDGGVGGDGGGIWVRGGPGRAGYAFLSVLLITKEDGDRVGEA